MKLRFFQKSRPLPDGAAFLRYYSVPCLFLLALLSLPKSASAGTPPDRPKLVVGIVVDQMRYDFLYRYWKYYGEGGFKRLVQQGYSFEQALYPYAPTITGPGHASIYTGTTPAWHGITANHWYDRNLKKKVYCSDADSGTVGLGTKAAMSPRFLQVTTLGDELKYATRGQGKVIGIALKDRGAILTAGRRADAAYWFEGETGSWVSSSYYLSALPTWVAAFNSAKSIQGYVQKPWAPLLPNILYQEGAGPDSSVYEGQLTRGSGTKMPIDIPAFFKGNYDLIRASGLGSAATTDFALAALQAEQLGQRGITDLLCLSYSNTDYVGHIFGPDSWECMDAYVRLDKELERLFAALDNSVGLKNTLIFLTADHGVAQIPDYAKTLKLPAGRYASEDVTAAVNARLAEKYGPEVKVVAIQEEQLYLDRELLKDKKLSLDEVAGIAAEALRSLPFVHNAWPAWGLKAASVTDPFARKIAMGCHPERSGDVFFLAKSGYLESTRPTGTTHGNPYAYDAHVPMLFFGWGVQPGETVDAVSITDIAPTVAAMLKIQMPSATTGLSRAVPRKHK